MPDPCELTEEEVAAEAARLEGRRRAADRADAGLYSEMYALLFASKEELDELPRREAEYIRSYRGRADAGQAPLDEDAPGVATGPHSASSSFWVARDIARTIGEGFVVANDPSSLAAAGALHLDFDSSSGKETLALRIFPEGLHVEGRLSRSSDVLLEIRAVEQGHPDIRVRLSPDELDEQKGGTLVDVPVDVRHGTWGLRARFVE